MGVWAGGQLVQQVLTLFSGILIARALGASDYGIANILRNLMLAAATVAPLGLDLALLKHLGRHRPDEPGMVATVRRLRLIVLGVNLALVAAVVSGLGAILMQHLYSFPDFDRLLTVTALGLPFASDLAVMGAVYKARDQVRPYGLLTLYLQPVVRIVLVVLAVVYSPDVFTIVCINTVQVIVSGLAILAHDTVGRGHRDTGSTSSGPGWPQVRAILGESVWMSLNLFVYAGMRFVDVLMLGSFVPAKLVGEYAALSTISQLVQFYPVAASQTLGPTVSKHFHNGDLAGVRRALDDYIRFASVAGGFVFAGIAVFGDRLDLLFGPSFRFRPDICILLPLGYLLSATLAPTGYALSMTGRHKAELAILAAGGALLVVLCRTLIPSFQQVGAASAVAASFLFINIVRFSYVSRVLGFIPGRPADVLPPIVALALAAAVRAGTDVVGERSILFTAMSCLVYAAVFGAIYYPVLVAVRAARTPS